MEDSKIMDLLTSIRDENRYENGKSELFEAWYADMVAWTEMRFENIPMEEMVMMGSFFVGLRMLDYGIVDLRLNEMSLNCYAYYKQAERMWLKESRDLWFNLESCKIAKPMKLAKATDGNEKDAEENDWDELVDNWDTFLKTGVKTGFSTEKKVEDVDEDRVMDIEYGRKSYGILEHYPLMCSLCEKGMEKHSTVVWSCQKILEEIQGVLRGIDRGKLSKTDWKKMLNDQYLHYCKIGGKEWIQKVNLELMMLDENGRKERVGGLLKEVMERISKSKFGGLHMECSDVYGGHWNGAKFVKKFEPYMLAEEYSEFEFEDIYGYLANLMKVRFLNGLLEGKKFSEEDLLFDDVRKKTEKSGEKDFEEKADNVCDAEEKSEENGEKVKGNVVRVEVDLLDTCEELLMNLSGYMMGKHTVKEVMRGMRAEVKSGGLVGTDLMNFLMAKGEKHCVGKMSVTHFFRMVKLMIDKNIMGVKGKSYTEFIRCGLGEYWNEGMANKFNKCLSESWRYTAGKGYSHIVCLMDDIVRGRWK